MTGAPTILMPARGRALGRYTVECRSAGGRLIARQEALNLLMTSGVNALLDAALSGVGYTAALYLGLIDGSGAAPTYGAADTMAAHPGWAELLATAGDTRPAVTFEPAFAGAKGSRGVVFAYDAPCTIAGFFLSTSPAKGGAAGILVSAAAVSSFERAPGDSTTLRWSLSLLCPAA